MSEESGLSKILIRALDTNVRYAGIVSQMATTALESLLSTVAEIGPRLTEITQPAQAKQPESVASQPAPAAIVLEGVAGSSAIGLFVVENNLTKQITTTVEVSPLTAPDGRQIKSVLRFEPGTITLAAGERVVAKVTAQISKRLIAGARYQGDVTVPGVPGARIPIIIRRKVDAAATAPAGKKAKSVPQATRKKKSSAAKKQMTRLKQRKTAK